MRAYEAKACYNLFLLIYTQFYLKILCINSIDNFYLFRYSEGMVDL